MDHICNFMHKGLLFAVAAKLLSIIDNIWKLSITFENVTFYYEISLEKMSLL